MRTGSERGPIILRFATGGPWGMPNIEQGLGIAIVLVALCIPLLVGARLGWNQISVFGMVVLHRDRPKTEAEVAQEREDRRERTSVERRQLETALTRYGEASEGVIPLVNASGPADQSLRRWFDLLCSSLAAALSKKPGDLYRVAIWVDLAALTSFSLLGSANFDANVSKMQTLGKRASIGGHAFRSKKGEYLCADITKDRRYKLRSLSPRPYKSILAIALGQHPRWGVITIDAPAVGGFAEVDLVIARRFARLASVGAEASIARYRGGGLMSPASPTRRIVGDRETFSDDLAKGEP